MTPDEFEGYHGATMNPGTILTLEEKDGLKWYCISGTVIVNATYDQIDHGTNIDDLTVTDGFSWPEPIRSLEDLDYAVNN